MRKIVLIILIFPFFCFSQQNCDYYLTNKDSLCYKACLLTQEAAQSQGTAFSQKKFDEAIDLCPNMDYAYFEKSVPYLKRGEFITWKVLIDKSVEINPIARLGYRGWCRFQFLSDYKGALEDFEKLEKLVPDDLGYSINGDYHLSIVKALCHKALGNDVLAIEIIERQLQKENYNPMPYDYLHLGVLKIKVGDMRGAIYCLEKEISMNDYLADTYYYLAIAQNKLGFNDKSFDNINTAKSFFLKGYRRIDPYTEPMDKIYLIEIEEKLNELSTIK